jgi:hypothetical protein
VVVVAMTDAVVVKEEVAAQESAEGNQFFKEYR